MIVTVRCHFFNFTSFLCLNMQIQQLLCIHLHEFPTDKVQQIKRLNAHFEHFLFTILKCYGTSTWEKNPLFLPAMSHQVQACIAYPCTAHHQSQNSQGPHEGFCTKPAQFKDMLRPTVHHTDKHVPKPSSPASF